MIYKIAKTCLTNASVTPCQPWVDYVSILLYRTFYICFIFLPHLLIHSSVDFIVFRHKLRDEYEFWGGFLWNCKSLQITFSLSKTRQWKTHLHELSPFRRRLEFLSLLLRILSFELRTFTLVHFLCLEKDRKIVLLLKIPFSKLRNSKRSIIYNVN